MIKVQHLTVRGGSKKVCEDLLLNIDPGSVCAVMGPNGVGKTTVLHSLAGLSHHFLGEVFVAQKNIKAYAARELGKLRSLLLQNQHMDWAHSVFEHVMMGRYPWMNVWGAVTSEDCQCVEQVLDLLLLRSLRHKNVGELSGGEQRRVAIAQVLAQNTPLIFLDEPTNHLDLDHAIRLMNHLKYLAVHEKRTIVMVTHDLNVVAHYCDEALLLCGNGKAQFGRVADILNTHTLEVLYQRRLHPVMERGKTYWIPQFEEGWL